MIPANHRQAERKLIALVRDGRWRIDADGHVWRRTKRGEVTAEKLLTSGYSMVRAMIGGVRVVGLAHRLVWQDLHGDIPDGLVINHKNGRKGDNRPCNLEPATYGDNARHAHRVLGVNPQSGQHNPASKLTPSDVAEIRLAKTRGERAVDVAARFGVRFQHIYKLWKGERWGHLAAPDRAGADPAEWPGDLRVREFPEARR